MEIITVLAGNVMIAGRRGCLPYPFNPHARVRKHSFYVAQQLNDSGGSRPFMSLRILIIVIRPREASLVTKYRLSTGDLSAYVNTATSELAIRRTLLGITVLM